MDFPTYSFRCCEEDGLARAEEFGVCCFVAVLLAEPAGDLGAALCGATVCFATLFCANFFRLKSRTMRATYARVS